VKAAKALVLFSGGQDSTTCLAWALNHYEHVETIGFDYGQRHRVELEVRPRIISALRGFSQWPGTLGDDHVIDLGVLGQISQGALTQDVAIAMQANGLPNTFVPGRNILFMIFAAAVAYRRGIKNIITGVCETDYSGYPDCRDDTMKAVQIALNLGMESRFTIHTPLMWIDKAQTWALAEALGQEALLTLIRDETHTCYYGDRTQHHEWGWGCGVCPACELRATGFERFQAMRVG
jgi:7-cyano-7-deazaguanine synthase